MDTMVGTVIQEIEEGDCRTKFLQALKDKSTFRNCAGFTKYMIGCDSLETFVSPNDLSEKGLLKYLKPISRLDLNEESPSSVDEKIYLDKASEADVIALLVNKKPEINPNGSLSEIVNDSRNGWMYVHFAAVDPEKK